MNLHGVRMWVTEGCNASCHFCLNAKARGMSSMEIERFQKLCEYFSFHRFDKIAIMGGEPTLHPDFNSIMKIAKKYFNQVYLFTNALESDQLLLYEPRNQDVIVYNSLFADKLSEDKLLLSKSGKRVLDVVVDSSSEIKSIASSVGRLLNEFGNRVAAQIVINNNCNIFSEKDVIVQKINELYDLLSSIKGTNVSFSCNVPVCFTEGTQLPPFTDNFVCSPNAVLIDADYNLRFCNNYSERLVNLFRNDAIIPFAVLKNYIRLAYEKMQVDCLSKICCDCLYYDLKCNGKCFIGQTIISRKDVENNTNLLWLKKQQL